MNNDIAKEQTYFYWRGEQRKQLGVCANLYFLFSSALLGFVVNLLVEKEPKSCPAIVILIVSSLFLISAVVLFGVFNDNRLKDFRMTARLSGLAKTPKEIEEETDLIGKKTWTCFFWMRGLLFLGFIFSIIGISVHIFL